MRLPWTEAFRSTAFRIAGLYSVLFVASLIGLLSVIYWKSTTEFEGDLREKIGAETAALLAIHQREGLDALVRVIAQRDRHDYFYGLQRSTGERLVNDLGAAPLTQGWYQLEVAQKPDDEKADTITVKVLGTPLADAAILAVGASDEGVEDLQEIILYTSSWVVGLTAILALTGGLMIYRSSMRRVDTIARSSRDMMVGDLTLRLPLKGTGDEFDRLSGSINQMLGRIEELMATMKQVTSDIAHDLRTPLGRLRQKLELAREGEATIEGCQVAFEQAISETDGILQTFDALLRIGKIDAGGAALRFADVDMSDLVARVSESYRAVIEDNSQTITTEIESAINVSGDRELLTQMLVNLIENAIRHSSGAQVTLRLFRSADTACLTVADNGAGVPPEEMSKILRPFYRLEQSRSSDGSGLGLALVDAIARLHKVRLQLSDNCPGLKVLLVFPRFIKGEHGPLRPP